MRVMLLFVKLAADVVLPLLDIGELDRRHSAAVFFAIPPSLPNTGFLAVLAVLDALGRRPTKLGRVA